MGKLKKLWELHRGNFYILVISMSFLTMVIVGILLLGAISKNADLARQNTVEIKNTIDANYQKILDDHRLQQRFIDCIVTLKRVTDKDVKKCKEQAKAPIKDGLDLFDRSNLDFILKENEKK